MDTNLFHLDEGAYALPVRKGKPDGATRKRLPLADPDATTVACAGCERVLFVTDDGAPSLALFGEVTDEVIAYLASRGVTVVPMAKVVHDTDRPNGVGIVVTTMEGEVIPAPYSEATVPCCPSCNRGGMRKRFIDRIRNAHAERIRKVGRRV